MLHRRAFNIGAFALWANGGVRMVSAEEPWPSRYIQLVVPFPPGGANDIIARILAAKLSVSLKQSVIVENRPGAGGTIGAAMVARSAPDGYTIMLGFIGNLAFAPLIYENLRYDPLASFAPISLVAKTPMVLVVNPSLPVHSLKELIAYTKDSRNTVSYSSGGIGTASHVGLAYLCSRSGMRMTHVPYRGTAPSITDVIAGQIGVTMSAWPGISAFVQAGQLRALAVSSTTRAQFAPDLPTIEEEGFQGFECVQWYGISAPANTPEVIVSELNSKLKEITASPEVIQSFVLSGAIPETSSPEAFEQYIRNETGRWHDVFAEAKILHKA